MSTVLITPRTAARSWQRHERLSRQQIRIAWGTVLCGLAAALVAGPSHEVWAAKPEIVHAQAYQSDPFGVGVVEIELPLTGQYSWHPDEVMQLQSQGKRIWYPAFRQRSVRQGEKTRKITALFLTKGDEPLSLSLVTPGFRYQIPRELRPVRDGDRYRATLQKWWDAFCNQGDPREPEEFRAARRYLQQMLARRLATRLKAADVTPVPVKSLEQQFERLVSLLFGFEAARLALVVDQDDEALRPDEPAEFAVPESINIPSGMARENFQEPAEDQLALARYVPEDCFYLRCGQVSNYLWVRHLIMSWGGNLSDVVATSAIDRFVRERIEKQLGLDKELLIRMQVDKEVVDFALIGTDVYFYDGAGVGAMFQARSQKGLAEILETLRQRFAERWGATEEWVQINGQSVSLYSTKDQTMRSLYVTKGDIHLITNSMTLAKQFLETENSNRSLANRKEFRYALAQLSEERRYAYVYLSDPFLRRLISPETRIELARRRRSMRDLQAVVLAQAAARAEGFRASSLDVLIRNRFLPDDFGERPDGSQVQLTAEGPVDSKRGRLGAFLPIADISVERVTRSERDAYRRFAQSYRNELKAVDPIMLAFGCRKGATPNEQQVTLDVLITPCSQDAYRFLGQYLASSPTQRVPGLLAEDVMGVSAVLRTADGTPVQVHAGLQDDELSFKLQNGEVIRTDSSPALQFGLSHAYEAVRPGGAEARRLLNEFVSSVQNREVAEASPLRSDNPVPAPGVIRWLLQMMEVVDPPRQQPAEGWDVTAFNTAIRKRVEGQLALKAVNDNAQVHFCMSDVHESQIADYLNAHTYLRTRRVSAAAVLFLSQLAASMNVGVNDAAELIENASAVRVSDPFGGRYGLWTPETGIEVLESVGAGVPRGSLYAEDKLPDAYQFAFLDWLRKLEVFFTLTETALKSRIHLRLHVPDLDPIDWIIFHWMRPLDSQIINRTEPPFLPGVLGVRVAPDLTVISVRPNSPAKEAGISEGDRITEVNGNGVKTAAGLVFELAGRPENPGSAVISVLRPSKKGFPKTLHLEADVSGAKPL